MYCPMGRILQIKVEFKGSPLATLWAPNHVTVQPLGPSFLNKRRYCLLHGPVLTEFLKMIILQWYLFRKLHFCVCVWCFFFETQTLFFSSKFKFSRTCELVRTTWMIHKFKWTFWEKSIYHAPIITWGVDAQFLKNSHNRQFMPTNKQDLPVLNETTSFLDIPRSHALELLYLEYRLTSFAAIIVTHMVWRSTSRHKSSSILNDWHGKHAYIFYCKSNTNSPDRRFIKPRGQ